MVGEFQPRLLPNKPVTAEKLLSFSAPQLFTYKVGTNSEHWEGCSKV